MSTNIRWKDHFCKLKAPLFSSSLPTSFSVMWRNSWKIVVALERYMEQYITYVWSMYCKDLGLTCRLQRVCRACRVDGECCLKQWRSGNLGTRVNRGSMDGHAKALWAFDRSSEITTPREPTQRYQWCRLYGSIPAEVPSTNRRDVNK